MRLTVLGCAGTYPAPDRACSSYLVEAGGYRLLLDCGNGSLTNLQRHVDVADLDGLLISHLHPDHFADLYGLFYALRFHPDSPQAVPVYAPAGAFDFIGQLLPRDSRQPLATQFAFQTAAAGNVLALGPLTVSLFAANHPVETLAARIEAAGTVLAFSADSGPTAELVDCARDADLFICDATWLDRAGPYPPDLHMTGVQAGRLAAEAGAQRLLVSHVFPRYRPADVAAEAATTYNGEVLAAADGQEHAW